jgi:hypothetical protein
MYRSKSADTLTLLAQIRKWMDARTLFVMLLPVIVAACAADAPPPYAHVETMKAGEESSRAGFPPPGIVWRLDERDLKTLSPAPIVEPPPPPRLPPPPRPNDPPLPAPYYGPPYYGPYWHSGPSFYYWRRW